MSAQNISYFLLNTSIWQTEMVFWLYSKRRKGAAPVWE